MSASLFYQCPKVADFNALPCDYFKLTKWIPSDFPVGLDYAFENSSFTSSRIPNTLATC